MSDEILRLLGDGAIGEIGGRADGDKAPVRPDAHRDHVLLQAFAQADTGIEPIFDDVA